MNKTLKKPRKKSASKASHQDASGKNKDSETLTIAEFWSAQLDMMSESIKN